MIPNLPEQQITSPNTGESKINNSLQSHSSTVSNEPPRKQRAKRDKYAFQKFISLIHDVKFRTNQASTEGTNCSKSPYCV